MDLSHLFKISFYWLATIAGTGNIKIGFDGDVLDAVAGETFLVKTWADNGQLKSITVSRDNAIRLIMIFIKSNLIISKDHLGVILLQYNNATREMSLILENVSKSDEVIYNVEEIVADTSPNAFEREAGVWNFKLNVIEPGEIEECDVGGIFTMEINNSFKLHNLYYYDQIVANLMLCDVAIHSQLHGRLRCRTYHNKYVIIIHNVTQRDIGLYSVDNTNNGSDKDSKRYYLNVTDQTTNAIIGENVNIDWFYSQQAINRTLWIIHSNNGKMMIVPPNNKPQIVTAFRNRLLYTGDVSRGYMSFTLLNIAKSDSGVFKIETINGNTVPGCKYLIVKGTLTDSSTARGLSLAPLTEILGTEEYTKSPSVTVHVTSLANPIITYAISVPIYVIIPVVIVTVMMLGYVIWTQNRRLSILETDRLHLLEECGHELYITPIGGEIHPPIPLMNGGHASDPRTAQFDTSMLILHANQNMYMDEYETVNVSSNNAAERVCNNDETVYDPTESINKPVHDNFGYLTVLGVLETSV